MAKVRELKPGDTEVAYRVDTRRHGKMWQRHRGMRFVTEGAAQAWVEGFLHGGETYGGGYEARVLRVQTTMVSIHAEKADENGEVTP